MMLRSAIALTAAPARSLALAARRTYVNLAPISTSHATSSGSRAAGHVKTDQGTEFKMDLQKELGGAGKQLNPEVLLAAGYGTCFLSALAATHGNLNKDAKPLPKSAKVDTEVTIGKDADEKTPGFFLAVNLKVHSAPLKEVGLSDEQIHKLVEEAHKLCPYSRAFKGNVDVKLSVI
ncbi:hypothetical protein JCM10296v2_007221 [Rhodotorula toruloides]